MDKNKTTNKQDKPDSANETKTEKGQNSEKLKYVKPSFVRVDKLLEKINPYGAS